MINIGIVIYPQAEVLDYAGPFEVFSTASRLSTQQQFTPILLSEQGGQVKTRAGFTVNTQAFADSPALDILLVAGGVHPPQLDNKVLLHWLQQQAPLVRYVTSVCTGAFILAAAGCIQQQTVTTHWEDLSDLRQQFPALNVIENVRWVQDDKVVTSAGIAAGIDMSLYLVSLMADKALADKTARQMDIEWRQTEAV